MKPQDIVNVSRGVEGLKNASSIREVMNFVQMAASPEKRGMGNEAVTALIDFAIDLARKQPTLLLLPGIELVSAHFGFDGVLDTRTPERLIAFANGDSTAEDLAGSLPGAFFRLRIAAEAIEALLPPPPTEDDWAVVLDSPEQTTALELAEVLGRLDHLYEQVLKLTKEQHVPLRISHVVSGSSVQIDLKGAEGAVKQCKQLVLSIWDSIRHPFLSNHDRRMASVRSALNTLKEVNETLDEDAPETQEIAAVIVQDVFEILKHHARPMGATVSPDVDVPKLTAGAQQQLQLPAQTDTNPDPLPAPPLELDAEITRPRPRPKKRTPAKKTAKRKTPAKKTAAKKTRAKSKSPSRKKRSS